MKRLVFFLALVTLQGETSQERGKRIVNECLNALGGDRYLSMQDRAESGRAYSFYREQLSGLSVAKIYYHYYRVADTAHDLAIRERENFGKKEDYGVLFTEKEAYEITYRGARPLESDRFDRYKETTMRDVLYILRVRFHEPGLIFESKGADVLLNAPVEIVEITDADNRTTRVYFHQTTKLPLRQVFYRRNAVTKERDEEITLYSKYRDIGGGAQWPYAVERHRNGEKIFVMFADSIEAGKSLAEDLFNLPAAMKVLK